MHLKPAIKMQFAAVGSYLSERKTVLFWQLEELEGIAVLEEFTHSSSYNILFFFIMKLKKKYNKKYKIR